MGRLTVGTRGSPLALWQARHVAALLRANDAGLTLEERIVKTEGDELQHAPIPREARGIFVRSLEQALLDGAIDLAVHSLKDMPTEQPEGLVIAAVLARDDPRDALVSAAGFTLENLPRGAVVGTGSPRRRCQLLHSRPDLEIVPVRGNVDTRVGLVRRGEIGAVVLALCGLERLGIEGVAIEPLAPSRCVPAVGQGVLAIEIRSADRATRSRVEALDDARSRCAVTAERSFLARLGGGCLAPASAYVRAEGQGLVLEAVVGDPDGLSLLLEHDRGSLGQAAEIGARAAERLLVAGGAKLLRRARARFGDDGPGA